MFQVFIIKIYHLMIITFMTFLYVQILLLNVVIYIMLKINNLIN